MIRKYFFPFIAFIGAVFALMIAFWSEKKQPSPPIPFPPPTSPYIHAIAGEGIVEPGSKNISVGSPFSEVITKIYVTEGDRVKAGDPLFLLDTRYFEAQAETARNQIRLAKISYENAKIQFSFFENLKDKSAVSQQQYEQSYFMMREAEEQIKVFEAQLGEVEANLARSLITAPIQGEILQVNIHVGEIAPNVLPLASQLLIPYGSAQYPLILMGNVDPLHLRIDIDEEDAWRYQKGSPATAFVRGNSHIHFPLKFVRIEPYIIPKASFTGQTFERIDTRVLQVLYRFERKDLPVYAGQLLDVFIESPPLSQPSHKAGS